MIKKPSYSLFELLPLIQDSYSHRELALIRELVWEEQDRYPPYILCQLYDALSLQFWKIKTA